MQSCRTFTPTAILTNIRMTAMYNPVTLCFMLVFVINERRRFAFVRIIVITDTEVLDWHWAVGTTRTDAPRCSVSGTMVLEGKLYVNTHGSIMVFTFSFSRVIVLCFVYFHVLPLSVISSKKICRYIHNRIDNCVLVSWIKKSSDGDLI